jgi:hypothetical protein
LSRRRHRSEGQGNGAGGGYDMGHGCNGGYSGTAQEAKVMALVTATTWAVATTAAADAQAVAGTAPLRMPRQ